jgi:glycosyltransferase involved in cell wall biosynthesis
VLVVNDGSDDNTLKNSIKSGAKVITNNESKGYDQAIIQGMISAYNLKYKILITIDADGQHPINFIPVFTRYIIEEEYKVVLGVRDFIPRYSEKLFNFYTKKFHGVPDVLCGMKAYSSDIFITINQKRLKDTIGTYYALESSRRNIKIKSINVKIKDRIIGYTRFGSTIKAELRIIKALLKAIRLDLLYSKSND